MGLLRAVCVASQRIFGVLVHKWSADKMRVKDTTAEARRLIEKFFPESVGLIPDGSVISFVGMLNAMDRAGLCFDASCDPFASLHFSHIMRPEQDESFASRGGFSGASFGGVYERILDHTGISPSGRIVLIPDNHVTVGTPYCLICDVGRAVQRVEELEGRHVWHVFDGSNDTLIVYESGEAIAIDHDRRLWWATSRMRVRR